MSWILRTSNDLNNPTLPGGVYGKFITAGRPVYYAYDGSQTRGILFISDGGKYGLDQIDAVEYKGQPLAVTDEWIFHRGTIPAQIVPKNVSAINTTTNVWTAASHGFANADLVRIGVINGVLPSPISGDDRYQVKDISGSTFKIYTEDGLSVIDVTTAGTGQVIIWKANAGLDDPSQGLPTFCPEVNTNFNNIAYIEFKLPTSRSSASEQPDWEEFRIVGIGRRLMDYNSSGAEVGIVTDDTLLSNLALQVSDNFLVGNRGKSLRIDWASWYTFRQSAATDVWQRVVTNDEDAEDPGGLIARWYGDHAFANLIITESVANINFPSSSSSPAPGVSSTGFAAKFSGRIKPEFSELYTLSFEHDDWIKVYINGVKILDQETDATDTVQYLFEAGTLYDLDIEFNQFTGPWYLIFRWSSASQSLQVVPATRLYPSDEIVKRYECHTAFPSATEAGEVHERLMERAPGWDWSDRDGKITFLGPDRTSAFAFSFDKIDDDSRPNFVKNSLTKKRRYMSDRKNFMLFRFRNVRDTGYPFDFVQADRPDLRRFTNGEPSNDLAADLGVSTRSLAERMGEMQMVLLTDPDHLLSISGARSSTVIRKCDFITVSYYDNDQNFVANARYLVTFHAWGARNERNDFTGLPISDPFYIDEPV